MIKLMFSVLIGGLFIFGLTFTVESDEPKSRSIESQVDSPFADILFYYEDEFSMDEKKKLESWLSQTSRATQQVLGIYPFTLHFYLHRSENAGEPVPWANTQRSADQGVHFHVNPSYSLSDFLNDWTAPHEISHLAIPFVGKSNAWFAEGFATYMQNEILFQMGECTRSFIDEKFASKLSKAKPYYQVDEPFAEVAMSLRKKHHYPEMYWGGALFFVQLDSILKRDNDIDIDQLLTQYQVRYRLEDKNLNSLLNSWDSLVEGDPANDLMKLYRTSPARDVFIE